MKAPFCGGLFLLVTLAACHHAAPGKVGKGHGPRPPTDATPGGTPALSGFAVDAVKTQEGRAIWYDVPPQSLPERKAWTEEMTAASDALPQNSYARVRRVDGKGMPVVVRITDSGVHHKGALVDVSHAAAEALNIIKSGEAQVRVESLTLKNATTDKPVEKRDEPTAAKITGTPAVSQQAEKDAAQAKPGGQSAP